MYVYGLFNNKLALFYTFRFVMHVPETGNKTKDPMTDMKWETPIPLETSATPTVSTVTLAKSATYVAAMKMF